MTSLRTLPFRLTATLFVLAVGVMLAAPVAAQLTKADIDKLKAQAQAEGWTFTVSENDATQYSLEQLCGFKVPDVLPSDMTYDPMVAKIAALPSSFDWRVEAGGLPPVRNQGGCGSCWAFATVGPLECNIKIKDGKVVDLSEQYLVNCNANNWGCAGGWWAHRMHYNAPDACGGSGAVLEKDFPYVARDGACACPYPHEYTIDGWAYIGTQQYTVPSVTQLKQAIMQYGPISVAVSVNNAFQAYSGGIFTGCSNGDINHAVTLVGWDDNQGPAGVWIMRNSWGSGWGEGGYMRIPYGCSYIGYNATYINYRGSVWFETDSSLARPPVDVSFTAETALGPTSWSWDFGDGQSSAVQNPSHTYAAPGCYDVTVTIETPSGQFSSTEERCVMVQADTIKAASVQAQAGQSVAVDLSLHNYVPINEIVFPITWDGAVGLVLDSVSTVGLRTSQLTPQQMHYDMTRAAYKLAVVTPQPEIAPGNGPVLRLWYSVPGNATGGTNPVTVATYSTGLANYSPTATTDNGVYMPVVTAGSVTTCRGGDVNGDGVGPDLTDLSFMINYLMSGSPNPPYMSAANVDGKGSVDLSDLSRLIGYLIGGGSQLTCSQF